jgi:hypothetical protein
MHRHPWSGRTLSKLVAAACTALLLVGCGGSSSSDATPTPTPAPSTSTDFTGTLVAANGTSANLSLHFASTVSAALTAGRASSAATVSVTGTLQLGATTINLTGTYDSTTHGFVVNGGGYTLTGQITAGGIVGVVTTPTGGGGSFTALAGTSSTVTVYCGTYSGASSGTWNIVQNGAAVNGAASGGSSGTSLTGSISGNGIQLQWPSGTATGAISGTSVSGTWTDTGGGGSGSFSGTKC